MAEALLLPSVPNNLCHLFVPKLHKSCPKSGSFEAGSNRNLILESGESCLTCTQKCRKCTTYRANCSVKPLASAHEECQLSSLQKPEVPALVAWHKAAELRKKLAKKVSKLQRQRLGTFDQVACNYSLKTEGFCIQQRSGAFVGKPKAIPQWASPSRP